MITRYPYILFLLLILSACTHPPTSYTGQYPDEVGEIIVNRCATAGCHNDKSSENAAGLRLDTWQHLLEGSVNGAVAIPFRSGNSSLLYFINTNPDIGPALQPTMPVNGVPLSEKEYRTIKDWIDRGAPDKTGAIPFSAAEQKIYVTQQGCDLVAVIDAKSGLIMRYFPIGKLPTVEVPHCVRFAPDGKYAYVTFTNGPYLQKIDVATDQVVADLYLGPGSWNLFHISDDGKKMMVTDFGEVSEGKLQLVDLETMSLGTTFYDFANPHGIASTKNFDTFFITQQYGNTLYRVTDKGNVRRFGIDGRAPHPLALTLDPHEVQMSPDRTKLFFTCQASNEVRVMDARTLQPIDSIPVGTFPQEFAISHKKPYLFVSCQEDITPEFPGFRGSVYVINYETLEIVKRIPGPFFQIHGLAVDDRNDRLFFVSRNVSSAGPAPHHTSECGGRNGYYNVYDLNTLAPVTNKRFESTVDPYSADVRYK